MNLIYIYAKRKKIKALYLNEAAENHQDLLKKGWLPTSEFDPCRFIENLHNKCTTYQQVEEIDRLSKK